MPDPPTNAAVFTCLTDKCGEHVIYERKVLFGFTFSDRPPAPKVVYLTCPRGHTHRYTVTS